MVTQCLMGVCTFVFRERKWTHLTSISSCWWEDWQFWTCYINRLSQYFTCCVDWKVGGGWSQRLWCLWWPEWGGVRRGRWREMQPHFLWSILGSREAAECLCNCTHSASNSGIKTTACVLGRPVTHGECGMTFGFTTHLKSILLILPAWGMRSTGECLYIHLHTRTYVYTHIVAGFHAYECINTWLYEYMSVCVHRCMCTRCMAVCVDFPMGSSQSH